MRCRKCDTSAVINMRQHKLALCGPHYAEWFIAQTARAIEKYEMFSREDSVLVAVSGGKDSLALWDVLLQLGYRADGMYIGLGINDGVPYSDQSLEKTRAFAAQYRNVIASTFTSLSVNSAKQSPSNNEIASSQKPLLAMTQPHIPTLHIVDVEETYGKTIPEIAREKTRGHGKPCAACGLTKRYVMNRLAAEKGYAVLATGHNLYDEAAVLMQNTLHWSVEYLARQSPVLRAHSNRFARKVKPFVRFYERETATYAL
ncbi:MAG: tRNA 2-thiocytidine biosynthesis protein TtcA, partial [Chloroflexi bacterium]|nr:tRNA 2-thiocytidine biosynthesis protein TtcA [Chloroflexota bacterium]